MRIDIISAVPELLESPLSHSIVGRARRKGLVEIEIHNLRDYGLGPRKNVDDYSYGGDAGMVLCIEPMLTLGSRRIRTLADGWTVVTADGSLACHSEQMIAISPSGPAEILTPR